MVESRGGVHSIIGADEVHAFRCGPSPLNSVFDGPSESDVTQQELIEAIRATFPPGRLLEPNDVATCPCDDCSALRAAFQHRSWPDVSDATIDKHVSNLPLFTPVAFRQFLPAYMVRGLRRDDVGWQNEVLEFTCYQLLPDELDEHWHERIDGFTEGQTALIQAFLSAARARETNDYEPPNPAAIEFWNAKRPN